MCILTKKKLAIVSTYNEQCGNASYTHVLKVAFSDIYDVDVIPLDLFLLQKVQKQFDVYADEHIKSICRKLSSYDYVNIQFEAGLYGVTAKSILRRMKMLINAAPNLILTMHRVEVAQDSSLLTALKQSVMSLKAGPLFQYVRAKQFATLYRDIVDACRVANRSKPVWVKVHSRRESRVVKDLFKFPNCIHYPLAFLSKDTRDQLKSEPRNDLVKRFGLPEGSKVFGVFGYISNYKGIETAIRSLAYLPDNWYLLMVGSQHPQSVKSYIDVDPYLESIIDLIKAQDTERDAAAFKKARINYYAGEKGGNEHISSRITERVKFVGNLEDDDFVRVLRDIDAVVLPYIEVGQSMSGVIVLALEACARIIAANNFSVAETRRYFGDVFERFDIGNYIELAQRLQSEALNVEAAKELAFDTYNITKSVQYQADVFEGNVKNA